MQTYSELAGAIFTIQDVMLAFDVIGYLTTAYYLYKNLNKKFNPQDSLAIKLSVVAAHVAIAVVSDFLLLQIDAFLRSTIVLKEILAKLETSPEIWNTLSVSWNSPPTHKLMQFLYINRIVSLIALSLFSKQSKTNLISVVAQMGSLAGISSLKWIEMTQTFEWPLERLKSLSLTSHFIIHRTCASSAEHLQSTLQSIYHFTVNFFNESTWYDYWEITYQNGIEVGRQIVYKFNLTNNPIQSCGCNLIPSLTGYSIKAYDALYGAAKVVTNFS